MKVAVRRPEFPESDGTADGPGQASARPRVGRAARRARSIEDDPYRDLYFPDVATEADTRPIAADDANGRVIYLSSFSKTLAPGFRVAWLHAPEPIAAKLELAKQAADLCIGRTRSAHRLRGVPARHPREATCRSCAAHYERKRDVMVEALHRHLDGQLTWLEPRGGFFLWAQAHRRVADRRAARTRARARRDLRRRIGVLRRRIRRAALCASRSPRRHQIGSKKASPGSRPRCRMRWRGAGEMKVSG